MHVAFKAKDSDWLYQRLLIDPDIYFFVHSFYSFFFLHFSSMVTIEC